MKQEDQEILICDCNSMEHQIIIHYEEDENIAYCHIHLQKRPFWYRLKYGIKYIFGYHCRFGHWDEFIIGEKHSYQLYQLSQKINKNSLIP